MSGEDIEQNLIKIFLFVHPSSHQGIILIFILSIQNISTPILYSYCDKTMNASGLICECI